MQQFFSWTHISEEMFNNLNSVSVLEVNNKGLFYCFKYEDKHFSPIKVLLSRKHTDFHQ